jgi:serine/threonine protein phosphatase PrpC
MHQIAISENVEQMYKGQDYTISGETIINGQPIKYAVVFDGHGTSSVITAIRKITKEKMNDIMATSCPATVLFNYINDASPKLCIRGESSGSTMCMTRIFPNHIEIRNVGDSQAVLFKNGKIEFISETHDYDNEKERDRLFKQGLMAAVVESSDIKIVNEEQMFQMKSHYIIHIMGWGQLAITQALGHNGKTGIFPDITIIPYEEKDDIQIVLGSDGLFDMIIRERETDKFVESDLLAMVQMTGEEILKRAINRWLNVWEMHYDLKKPDLTMIGQYTKEQCDDVSVVKVILKPE